MVVANGNFLLLTLANAPRDSPATEPVRAASIVRLSTMDAGTGVFLDPVSGLPSITVKESIAEILAASKRVETTT